MNRQHILRAIAGAALALTGVAASASVTTPVIGKLLWSEEFNDAQTIRGNGPFVGHGDVKRA